MSLWERVFESGQTTVLSRSRYVIRQAVQAWLRLERSSAN